MKKLSVAIAGVMVCMLIGTARVMAAPKFTAELTASADMTQLETRMLEFINADRSNPANVAETQGHAMPLRWDPKLAAAALAHSMDMMRRHYFSHVDLNGNSPAKRLSEAGVPWRAMGENIAKNFTVARAEAAFMDEPSFQPNHRSNILNQRFNAVGVGIVRGPDGLLYVTQEFAQE
ncbi:MAG TPA: CAP domain-containing protein [Terriglobia bacterium]|nr:CAP domain-containing protein [Terriglobia bacterium]